MSFWKIVAVSLLVAILLATAHMELRNHFNQINDPRHYDTIGN